MKRVLVTGCNGFLGKAIARQLTHRGDRVVAFVRRRDAELDQLDVDYRIGDIRDSETLRKASEGVDALIHTAAIAGVWGPWKDYFAINTQGTESCIEACRQNGVGVLVYCSSPSVTFDGSDQRNIDETVPYPTRWLAHYPHTKALGEQAILAAHRPGTLHTAALRPHLIWGPDDPHLIPRLVERAKQGKLAIVGPGTNRMDTVHVENAALAHVLALDRLLDSADVGGRAYFITQDEPVGCWDWIGELLTLAKAPLPKRRIPLALAYAIGGCLEGLYKLTGRTDEPRMTRFVALQLGRDHWFNIAAARQLLGYAPRITTAEGLACMKEQWAEHPPAFMKPPQAP